MKKKKKVTRILSRTDQGSTETLALKTKPTQQSPPPQPPKMHPQLKPKSTWLACFL